MDEVSSDGVRLPGAAARLQHTPARSAIPPQASDEHVLVNHHLAEAESGCGLDGRDRGELEVAAERLQRRGRDKDLVDRFAVNGFVGPEYDLYRAELVAYALPVLMSWLRTGTMFVLCRDRGRPVSVPEDIREFLRVHRDERLELAGLVAATALNVFRDRALLRRGWTPEGGASLKTYFMGACINAFASVFRKWLTEHDQQLEAGYGVHAAALSSVTTNVLGSGMDVDPADVVAGNQFVRHELDRLDNDLTRELAGRIVLGDTHAEAGEVLGLSPEAVGQRFYRLRRERERREGHRDQRGGQPQ